MPMAENAYLTLKLAGQLFEKLPAALSADERRQVDAAGARQREIERRILAAPEAAQVVLAPSGVDSGVAIIRGRYEGEDDFHADLAANGLDEAALREAVARDLVVEAVLEGVASRAGEVADADVEIFYLTHRERFRKPEARVLRHVLVTISDSGGLAARAAARTRIEAVRSQLDGDIAGFEAAALAHSECPTAMNGGLLGRVPRGQLFAELESAAFALAVGEVSGVLESPLGFHVLRCDAVEAGRQLRLEEVQDSIRAKLEDGRRARAQKEWIAGLFRTT